MRERSDHMGLAGVLSQTTQPGLLEVELLLDDPVGEPSLGTYVSFDSFDEILQASFWVSGKRGFCRVVWPS